MGLAAAVSILSGVLVHITAAVFGLSLVLRNSAVAYTAVKYVGAAFPVYLGIQELQTTETIEIADDDFVSTGRDCRTGVDVEIWLQLRLRRVHLR